MYISSQTSRRDNKHTVFRTKQSGENESTMTVETSLPSSSAIEPRMSVCLKGSLPLIDIDELSLSQHSSASWLVDVMQDSDSGDSDSAPTATARRSALSSSSILMTGTPYSILRTSGNKSDYRRQERLNSKKRHSIRFSESVHVRNHLHHNQISSLA